MELTRKQKEQKINQLFCSTSFDTKKTILTYVYATCPQSILDTKYDDKRAIGLNTNEIDDNLLDYILGSLMK